MGTTAVKVLAEPIGDGMIVKLGSTNGVMRQ